MIRDQWEQKKEKKITLCKTVNFLKFSFKFLGSESGRGKGTLRNSN